MNIAVKPPRAVLTAERAREVLAYDPETGKLTWRISRPGAVAGDIAGTPCDGYVQIQIDYVFYRAHRVIWLMMTGAWPERHIDHRNRVRDDNRWDNLREATPLENSRNKSPSSRTKSGVVGVCWLKDRGKWNANIGLHNRTLDLGCFEAKDDAIAARCEAERHYFGEFAAQAAAYQMEGAR